MSSKKDRIAGSGSFSAECCAGPAAKFIQKIRLEGTDESDTCAGLDAELVQAGFWVLDFIEPLLGGGAKSEDGFAIQRLETEFAVESARGVDLRKRNLQTKSAARATKNDFRCLEQGPALFTVPAHLSDADDFLTHRWRSRPKRMTCWCAGQKAGMRAPRNGDYNHTSYSYGHSYRTPGGLDAALSAARLPLFFCGDVRFVVRQRHELRGGELVHPRSHAFEGEGESAR